MTDCSICFDAVTATTGRTTLSCGHEFHLKCIGSWLMRSEAAATCPCCRSEPTEHERLATEDSDDEESVSSVDPLRNALMAAGIDEEEGEFLAILERAECDINARDRDGDTVLVYILDKPALVKAVLRAGLDPNIPDIGGTPPIFAALDIPSQVTRLEVLRLFIEHGANLNTTDTEGELLLEMATRYDDLAVLRLLLDNGALGLDNALFAACREDSVDCARELLARGANPNARSDPEEWTPLMVAVQETSDLTLIELLLKHGANPSTTDADGWTVLMHYARNEEPERAVYECLVAAMGASWKRHGDGSWSRAFTSVWSSGDTAEPPPDLALVTNAAAKKIQATWRGRQTRSGMRRREAIKQAVSPWIMARMLRVV